MKVAVIANVEQQKEIASKNTSDDVELTFINDFAALDKGNNYDAIFYLTERYGDIELRSFKEKPVFINEVIATLEQNNLPPNFSRINGWPGFLKRPTWEVVSNNQSITSEIFKRLGWKIIFVKDEPGLVAARIISMIVNEAYFALQENVSSIREIDLAMKSGTNYPFGPFEWQGKIGIQNIYKLLRELSVKDKRYTISPLLEKKYHSSFS